MQVFPSITGVEILVLDGDIVIFQRHDENDTESDCVVIPLKFSALFKRAFAIAVQQAKEEGRT